MVSESEAGFIVLTPHREQNAGTIRRLKPAYSPSGAGFRSRLLALRSISYSSSQSYLEKIINSPILLHSAGRWLHLMGVVSGDRSLSSCGPSPWII